MTKKLVSLVLALVLTLCLLPAAQAAKLTVQELTSFTEALTLAGTKDNQYGYNRIYKANDASNVPAVILGYLEYLAGRPEFDYVDFVDEPDEVFEALNRVQKRLDAKGK